MASDKATKPPEPLATARAAIEGRRAQLLADHQTAVAALNADLAALKALERTAAEIVKRYSIVPELSATDAPATPRPTKPKAKSKRAGGGGKPSYTPAEDALIIAAVHAPGKDKDKFAELEKHMPGRTAAGLSRHALDLKKQPSKRSEPEWSEPEQVGSETAAIVEATQNDEVVEPIEPSTWEPPPLGDFDEAAASSEIVNASRAQEATKLRRPPEAPYNWPAIKEDQARVDPADFGRTPTGAAVDNGPRDRRVIDHPAAYTSRNSD